MLKINTTLIIASIFATLLLAGRANSESVKPSQKTTTEAIDNKNAAGELQTGYAPVPLAKNLDAPIAPPAINEPVATVATPVEPENRTIISSSTTIEGCNNGLIIVGSKFSCPGAEEKAKEAAPN